METLSHLRPEARKDHRCDYCNGIIQKGEVYDKSTHKYDGYIYTWKSHWKCSELTQIMNMQDECDEGITEQDFYEIVNDRYSDLIGDINYGKTTFQERLDFVYNDYKKYAE